ncbi:MAG: SIMPL domain-containing protein [Planctomycetaceae bacterium]|nr:SIMPL domain-containing protein [Planctomycetaceae bacterium]
MRHRVSFAVLVTLNLGMSIGPAIAADQSDGTVSGTGVVTVRPTPTRLRMQMQFEAYGKTPDAAVKNLNSRREAMAARLKELKADSASITFVGPRVGPFVRTGPVPPGYGTPMPSYTPAVPTATATPVYPSEDTPAPAPTTEAPTLQPVPAPGSSAPPTTPPPIATSGRPSSRQPAKTLPKLFTASTIVRAEWALPADEGRDRLAAVAADIEQKVREANLASGAANGLSGEEQELLEEASVSAVPQTLTPYSPVAPTITPGSTTATPTFVFVAKRPDDERKAALAEACARAKREAAELAHAVGAKLGPITSVTRQFSPSTDLPSFAPVISPGIQIVVTGQSESEVVATDASMLESSISVAITYRLVPDEKR